MLRDRREENNDEKSMPVISRVPRKIHFNVFKVNYLLCIR